LLSEDSSKKNVAENITDTNKLPN
jgi:hypothetical protein